MLTSIKSGQFFTDIPNATLFAEKVSENGDNFEEVFLHVKDKDAIEQRIIFASQGSLIKLFADTQTAPSLRLHLTDGNIIKINEKGDQIEKILFKEYDFPVFNTDMSGSTLDKDSMKTNAELDKLIEARQKNVDYLNKKTPQNDEEKKKDLKQKSSWLNHKLNTLVDSLLCLRSYFLFC